MKAFVAVRTVLLVMIAGICLPFRPTFAQTVWSGAGAGHKWSTGANWAEGLAPSNPYYSGPIYFAGLAQRGNHRRHDTTEGRSPRPFAGYRFCQSHASHILSCYIIRMNRMGCVVPAKVKRCPSLPLRAGPKQQGSPDLRAARRAGRPAPLAQPLCLLLTTSLLFCPRRAVSIPRCSGRRNALRCKVRLPARQGRHHH